MKTNRLLISIAGIALLGACAGTVPNELLDARRAYKQASMGPAAQIAPAELHIAGEALALAENSFKKDPDSYKTRDLAYVAQRKAELAMATAAITMEKDTQNWAKSEYRTTQDAIAARTKSELNQTRKALDASEQSGAATADQLSETRADLTQSRSDLAASKRSGELAGERLAAAQNARVAADQRAATAQAALAKLAVVKEEARGVLITLSGSVLFASNQATFLPDASIRLGQVADVLLTTPERNLIIEGHTDSQGTRKHNLELSQRRANEVRDFLVKRGYPAARIESHGLGEGFPVADNSTAEGRANNRRVGIIIESAAQTSNQ